MSIKLILVDPAPFEFHKVRVSKMKCSSANRKMWEKPYDRMSQTYAETAFALGALVLPSEQSFGPLSPFPRPDGGFLGDAKDPVTHMAIVNHVVDFIAKIVCCVDDSFSEAP